MCGQGFARAGFEKAAAGVGHLLIRPTCEEEPASQVTVFPSWLRQRIEAFNAVIWHDWLIGVPVKRSWIVYGH